MSTPLISVIDLLNHALSSPFLSLPDLHTSFTRCHSANHAPALTDIPGIYAVISERKAHLTAIEHEMALVRVASERLLSIQARLNDNKSQLQHSIQHHEALAAPVHRVPHEILGEIFTQCLPTIPYPTPMSQSSPMVLTNICRRWRAVAVSTPRLWSSITISVDKALRPSARALYKAWLSRAKYVSLSLRIICEMDIAQLRGQERSYALEWLYPYVPHCAELWLHGPPLQEILEVVPSLERLQMTGFTTRAMDEYSIIVPESSTQLRSVCLQNFRASVISLEQFTLPWTQLTELSIHFALFSSSVFLQLLHLCPDLHTLNISCVSADESKLPQLRGLPQGSVAHHKIRRLEIKTIQAGLDLLFDALLLPALQELDICFCHRERDPWPHAQFMAMLVRSRCPLERLTIRNRISLGHLSDYITVLPSLKIVAP
ncbi:hypothetical protein BJ138DRAFT_1148952 [Hygrophoropsis aurantiaca]|uniref:Uncharacterized protein n=1 Tax=Hygrophoropsis aurantiaca TaxID=72124 RepID=A0ACB8AG94_9AGAM|nr:hypothetical protein BJ138DRAFT_1148952 [Hygrophoropsis aurantiaca]